MKFTRIAKLLLLFLLITQLFSLSLQKLGFTFLLFFVVVLQN